jgi:hypothetical protein
MKTSRIKIIVLIAAIGMISYHAMAQQAMNVPQAVQTAFTAQYPQGHLKNWKMDKSGYVASFKLNKRECKATYANDGNWLSTETTFRHVTKHVSPDMKFALRNSRYASYHIDLVQDLQTPSKNLYLLQVDNNSGNQAAYENAGSVDDETLYFSRNGRLLRSVSSN